MAGINFPRTSIGSTTTDKRAVAEDVVIVNQVSTKLLDRISPTLDNLPIPCNELKFEWVEDEIAIFASTLQAAMTTTTKTTITVKAGDGEFFLVGHILLIGSEQCVVTTKGTAADIVKATRGYGGTTAATHLINVPVSIVGHVSVEGATAMDDTYVPATIPYNYIQLFEETAEFTDTAAMIGRYGEPDPWQREKLKKLKYIMKLMELNVFHGKRVQRTTVAAPATSGTFGGLQTFIDTSLLNALSAARVTKDHIDDLLAEQFALVGEEYMSDLIVCNSYNKRRISGFYEPFQRMSGESKGGWPIQSIETEWGVLDIMLNHNCPSDVVYFLHSPFLAIGPFEGNGGKDSFHWEDLARVGRKTKAQLSGQYTFMMKNPKCHGALTGTATS
jgi:hypothetical protein